MSIKQYQTALLDWYDQNKRSMPWRAVNGMPANPYHVWLSEIMLQQTTVVAVIPYFLKFVEKWPTVHDLAQASLDDVLTAWAGLGYYARARNLHKCANVVVSEYQGCFPDCEEGLKALPGVGPYTAAAITSIAFGREAVAVDGNVERVISRLYAVREAFPTSKPTLKIYAEKLVRGNASPSDFTQAFMELGALICTPKSPKCDLCPWGQGCQAHDLGIASELPIRAKKKKKPERGGTVFFIRRSDGRFLIRQRPDQGLLGGMMELPGSDWIDYKGHQKISTDERMGTSPVDLGGTVETIFLNAAVKHTFTHFHLYLDVVVVNICDDNNVCEAGIWITDDEMEQYAIPSLMEKAINTARKNNG